MAARKQVIVFNAVKSFCLDRSLTHVLLSWDSWHRYNSCVTAESRKRGIQSCACHQTVLMPTRWAPRDALIGMNIRTKGQMTTPVKQIVASYFKEDEKHAESIVTAVCKLGKQEIGNAIKVKKLPL